MSVGYKIYAAIVLSRLKEAGAEDKMWKTQFGFRSKSGTSEAFIAARRVLEMCLSCKEQQCIYLSLDGAKKELSTAYRLTAYSRLYIVFVFRVTSYKLFKTFI